MLATLVPLFNGDMSVASYCLYAQKENMYEHPHLLGAGKYDIIIVICGESVTPQESDDIYQRFRLAYSRSDVIMIDGGQPVYDYILVLE